MADCDDMCKLAAIRSGASLLCVVIISVLIGVVFCRIEWTTPVHRLLLYIKFASLLKLLAYAAQLVSVWSDSDHYTAACIGVGFTVQLTSWIVMLITLWLTVYLVFRYWWPHRETLTFPREIATWICIMIFSALVAAIPIIGDNYSTESHPWCWISNDSLEGILEQWLLNYLWQILLSITVIVLFVLTTCYTSRRRSQLSATPSRLAQQFNTEAKEIRYLIYWITGYLVLSVMTILIRLVNQATNRSHPFWLSAIFAVLVPIGVLVLPIAFLVHLHRIGRFKLLREKEPLLLSSHTNSLRQRGWRRPSGGGSTYQRLMDNTMDYSGTVMTHSVRMEDSETR